jgi:hypothetical protein
MRMRPARGLRLTLGEGLLQSDGALDSGHRPERGHEPVAHSLDLVAAVGLEDVARDRLVRTEHVAASGVAEAVHHRGVVHHVGEEDRADARAVVRVLVGLRGHHGRAARQLGDAADDAVLIDHHSSTSSMRASGCGHLTGVVDVLAGHAGVLTISGAFTCGRRSLRRRRAQNAKIRSALLRRAGAEELLVDRLRPLRVRRP